jgi:uncharacterized protein (TIRG00374 family)
MSRQRNLWRTLPGIAVSLFCLWWTFHKVDFHTLLQMRLQQPAWLLVLLFSITAGYTLRVHRWWKMLRERARFAICGRVLMTSFAANNIMPFRIGDLMRIFTYAGDLGVSSSEILSTVVLEKALDIFALLFILALTMWNGPHLNLGGMRHVRMIVLLLLGAISALLLVLLLGARLLESPIRRLIAAMPQSPLLQARLSKLENWLVMGLHTIVDIGILGTLWLIVESLVVWGFEGGIFVAAAHLIGLSTDGSAPWQALVLSNLFYMLPSMPGAIGTFETAAKFAMTSHGVPGTPAALYALLVHVVILFIITAVGGICFLLHRKHQATHKSLIADIDTLPEEMP